MNFDSLRSSRVRKLTMYTLATASGKERENPGRARGLGFVWPLRGWVSFGLKTQGLLKKLLDGISEAIDNTTNVGQRTWQAVGGYELYGDWVFRLSCLSHSQARRGAEEPTSDAPRRRRNVDGPGRSGSRKVGPFRFPY